MDHPISEEESYADRRQLFKNIWDTPINIYKKEENQEGNIINKPKVIKTARLNEINRCVKKARKKKKERMKNLRIVCNKLLEFCDRQDADDMFYEQMTSKAKESSMRRRMQRKSKTIKIWKAEKAKRMFTPLENISQAGIASPDKFLEINTPSRSSSPNNPKGTLLTVQENNRKREKSKRKGKFVGAKDLMRPCHECSKKRLFPVNKIYID